jgi:hypothetical protein
MGASADSGQPASGWFARFRKPAREDMPTVAFMACTVVLVVIGAVTSNAAFDLGGLAPLIIALAWTTLIDKQVLHEKLDSDTQRLMRRLDADKLELYRELEMFRRATGVTVHVQDNESDTYVHGRSILLEAKGRGGWESIRLYAPIGLWSNSASKDAWLNALASELGDSVHNLKMVAALPADKQVLLEVSVPMLRKFAAAPGTDMCFAPPAGHDQIAAAPFGVAVFADRGRAEYRSVLAFMGRPASKGHKTLTNTIVLDGEPASRILIDWFDNCLLRNYSANVLLGGDGGYGEDVLDERIEAIARGYYHQP